MTRLILFTAFLCSSLFVIGLIRFRDIAPENQKFDYQQAKQAYDQRQKDIEKALHPVKEDQKSEKKVSKVKLDIPLDTPELVSGHAAYNKKGKCITCHGRYGEGKKSQKAPRLAGQFAWYLEEQLTIMKKGIRVNAKMNPYLKLIDEKDIKDIALYLSKLPPWPID